jgi:hypothetical protein
LLQQLEAFTLHINHLKASRKQTCLSFTFATSWSKAVLCLLFATLNKICSDLFPSFCLHSHSNGFANMFPQSFCCDDLECKNVQHQNLPQGACRRSYIMSNLLNNNQSLSASRNNSFSVRPSSGPTINHGAHARRIAQLLLSPTGSLLPSSECSNCPPRRESTISETVC